MGDYLGYRIILVGKNVYFCIRSRVFIGIC